MARKILPESRIANTIRQQVASHHADIVEEVERAIVENAIVVVGMKQNPHPKRALAALRRAGHSFKYLEYGSYASQWRRRNALKMWTGWSTFPMVFVKGTLVGGASDLVKLIKNNELSQLLN